VKNRLYSPGGQLWILLKILNQGGGGGRGKGKAGDPENSRRGGYLAGDTEVNKGGWIAWSTRKTNKQHLSADGRNCERRD